jgi:hypothetical protein
MAVLAEALSVIVRTASISEKFAGGDEAFIRMIPNQTFCTDGDLYRVGFMTPDDVAEFVGDLARGGLTYLGIDGRAMDLVVVDMYQGILEETSWLEFARFPWGDHGGEVSAVWMVDPDDVGISGMCTPRNSSIHFPADWDYEKSLSNSRNGNFIANEDIDDRLRYLGHEEGLDVYEDRETGKRVYVGRTER